MPQIGSCTDIKCDDDIKELYECHCCLHLVCLNHLIEHVEITKQNKKRLDSLRNELNTVINTLKLIVDKKLLTIGREQYLIEQAKKLVDVPSSSIDELQNIFEQINQIIALNRSDSKYSTHVNHDFINTISFDKTTKFIKNQNINKKQKKPKRKSCRTIVHQCPLTFDGAFGLTQTNHCIEFCEYGKNHRIQLYNHFIHKHKLKEVFAQRLVQAIADNHDPKITKLFDENENVIDQFYKVLCPFANGPIDLPGYSRQYGGSVPCRRRILPFYALKYHLRHRHHLSKMLAQTLVDSFKEIRSTNNTPLMPVLLST
ncbi:unnamed protein product [Rotaria sp. Silwood1]|nr:unnamed protein product [Rotaria sp. Silwood1]